MRKSVVRVFGQTIPRFRDCPLCGAKNACEFSAMLYKGYEPVCKQCRPPIKKETILFSINNKVDIVAVATDENGQEVGITEKGNKVSMEDTRYNTLKDPYGWKAVGKKVREKDEKGVSYAPE